MKTSKRLFILLAVMALLLSVAAVTFADEPPHEHKFDLWVERVNPDNPCINAPYDVYKCSVGSCAETTKVYGQVRGHLAPVKLDTSTDPTCLDVGITKKACPDCGFPFPDEIVPALGHKFDGTPVVVESTCKDQGTKTYTCTREGCSATKVVAIPLKDHQWGNWTPAQADCTKGINQTGTCSECSATTTRNLPPRKHTWGNWVTTLEPTCTAYGSATGTCSVCGATTTKRLSKVPHTAPDPVRWLWDENDRSQDYMLCAKCNRIMKRRPHPGYEGASTAPSTSQGLGQQGQATQPIIQSPVSTGVQAFNFGPYARDLNPTLFGTFPDRFTPVDVSEDGVQTFPLITNNGYYIGMVNVTTSYGSVMVSYTMNDPSTMVSKEVLFLYPVLSAVTPEMLVNEGATRQFNQPIDLGGAQYIVLNVRLDVSFNVANPVNSLYSDLGVYVDGVQSNYDLLMEMADTLNAN
ncbi:MAG: hypothetical protein ACOX6G_08390 [Christensenellales bacterium]|jgi:hypothetical protein